MKSQEKEEPDDGPDASQDKAPGQSQGRESHGVDLAEDTLETSNGNGDGAAEDGDPGGAEQKESLGDTQGKEGQGRPDDSCE